MTETTSTPPCVTLDIDHAVATITLDRPQAMNAFNREQRERFRAALVAADTDDTVRAIVITGRGKAFCAGQDQYESAAMDAAGSAARIDSYLDLYQVFRALTKPVIARVNGVAAGAGLQIALMCDLRIASTQARFGMTEFKVGSAAIVGSALLWPIIGEAAMKRLVLLAEIVPAQQSLALGLVHEVVEDDQLDARVAQVCALVAGWSPTSVAITRSWWKEMGDDLFAKACATARSGHASNFASGAYSAGAKKFTSRERG
uniref:enoyl-CoA hydratase/isomerase family protein n=1 Tax=unclassified Variovorax TaxID=663243 RepID=UPI000D42D7D8